MQLLRYWMHKFQEKLYTFAFLTYASRAQVNIFQKNNLWIYNFCWWKLKINIKGKTIFNWQWRWTVTAKPISQSKSNLEENQSFSCSFRSWLKLIIKETRSSDVDLLNTSEFAPILHKYFSLRWSYSCSFPSWVCRLRFVWLFFVVASSLLCELLMVSTTLQSRVTKLFAQSLTNSCSIPTSQLPKPCLIGEQTSIIISEDEYLACILNCKMSLTGDSLFQRVLPRCVCWTWRKESQSFGKLMVHGFIR